MSDIKINERQLSEIVDNALNDLVDEIFSKSQQNLVDNDSVDTGFLLQSGNVNRVTKGHYRISYGAPYAQDIEFGSDGKTVPFGALYGWVTRKLGIKDPKEAKRVTFSIMKSIEKNGINPKPFLRPAIESTLDK